MFVIYQPCLQQAIYILKSHFCIFCRQLSCQLALHTCFSHNSLVARKSTWESSCKIEVSHFRLYILFRTITNWQAESSRKNSAQLIKAKTFFPYHLYFKFLDSKIIFDKMVWYCRSVGVILFRESSSAWKLKPSVGFIAFNYIGRDYLWIRDVDLQYLFVKLQYYLFIISI